MKKALLFAILAAAGLHAAVEAQQAGVNVSVLPVVQPGPQPSGQVFSTLDAALRGDLYLQRQLEPTIAVSTRNPNHVIAFFNDYRAVDIPGDFAVDDEGVAENEERDQDTFPGLALPRKLLAKLFRRPARPSGRPELPSLAAAAEAWVGMSRSDDGGVTWTGGFMPGSPFDTSPASLASPVKGLLAASDPVAFSAPCGYVHVVFIAFTRGGSSKMVVATYQDQNANEGGETFFYKGTSVVDVGSNASNGHFVDKPSIVVDVARGGSGDPCAHNIYLGYSTFVGLQKNGKIQTQLTVAKSTDNGLTFTQVKVNQSWNESQGSALAVDPRPGTPTTTGGGTVYVAWRHFDSPDTIVVSKSTDFGLTFSKGQALPAAPLATFDQPGFSTVGRPPADIAFRSNAFPTIAVADNGNVFVAWQERVSLAPGNGFGLPQSNGSPRIVLMRSTGGGTWTGPTGAAGQQQAVDLGDRDADPAFWPAPGLGFLPQTRPSGPQVMPKLSFGGGRLYLSYYESRGVLGPGDTILPVDTTGPAPGYITGIDRLMDLRGALLDPATGALLNGTATAQISRYPVRADLGILGPGHVEQLGDIEAVNGPCSPDFGLGLPACVRRVNRVGVPHSGGGTTPFIGDYIDATPIVTFVPDGLNGWRWASGASDVPYRAFRSIWTDNRNQVPPALGVAGYPLYGPAGTGASCVNPGSRNADVFTSLVNADLVVSAPTTFTKLGAVKHAYPVFVQNTTAVNRYFRFTIVTGADVASFDQFSNDPAADVIQNGIFAFSSFTAVVYVEPSATGTVKVNVQELICTGADCTPGGSSGTATINLDPTNTVSVDIETHNPLVPNPLVPNPLVPNPLVPNPLVPNPLVPNPLVPNPLVPNPLVPNITASNSLLQDPGTTIYNVQYGTTSVTNAGNTTTTFTPDIKIDNPGQYNGEYVFQLVVYKTFASGGFDTCSTSNVPGFQILASVPMTSDMLNPLVPNPFVPNPLVPNPLVPNPLVPNPLVPNATVTIAPSDPGPTEQNSHDGTKHAPKLPDEVHVALFAYQIVPHPTHVFNPNPPSDPVHPGDPPSIKVISASCNSDNTCPSAFKAPDLVVDGAPTVSPGPLVPGGNVQIGFTLKNQGNADANAPDGNFTHRVYLDTVAPANELGVLATSTGVLAAGASQPFTGTQLTIPATASPGPHNLLLFVDAEREVSEVDETNNIVAIPVTIQAPQTITFLQPMTPRTYGDVFGVSATSSSGLTVTIGASGGCTIDGSNNVTMTSGTTACVLTASQAGNGNYSAATDVPRTVNAQLKGQTITFAQPTTPRTYGDVFGVSATSSSGLTVTIGASGGCTIDGSNNVTMTSGTTACMLTASQAGNGNYSTATDVPRTVNAQLKGQTITFAQPTTPRTYGDVFGVSATSSSGLTVTIGASGGCTIDGSNNVTMTSGTTACVLTASQAGNGNYSTAAAVVRTVAAQYPPAPTVTATADPTTLLWSPNKSLLPVTVSGTALGTTVTVKYAVKDEYGMIQPSGTVMSLGTGGHYSFVVKLEAYRNGSDQDGRLYTITVTATDAFGRMASTVTSVRVPHDQQ